MESIWDYDVKPISNWLKNNGIFEFSISSSFANLMSILLEFEKEGFKVAGLIEINGNFVDWKNEERAIIPAIKLKWNESTTHTQISGNNSGE